MVVRLIDSPHSEFHGDYEEAIQESDEILSTLVSKVEMFHLDNNLNDYSIFTQYKNHIEESIVRVFNKLENEGIFLSIGVRNSYVLGCVCGDQSVKDKYEFCQKVNPYEALYQLASDAAFFDEQREKIFSQFGSN